MPDGDTTRPPREGMSPRTEARAGAPFTRRDVLIIGGIFLALVAAGAAFGRLLESLAAVCGWELDSPRNWPLSMFRLMVPGVHAPLRDAAVAAVVLLAFLLFAPWFVRRSAGNLPVILAAGLFFVLSTNLIHGISHGLVNPHVGQDQYYHQATRITSAAGFLRGFEATQGQLGIHGRTHPPGAVLFLYALTRLVRHPAAVSVAVAALAVVLSGASLYGLLAAELDRPMRGYVTLLLLLLSSVQIYYCATLDAIIAGCFLAVLFFFRHRNTPLGIAGALAAMFCASFLTFGAVFLPPVLLGFEIIARRSLRRSAAVFLGLAVLYGLVELAYGFNYLRCFRIACALENPQGFLLLADPAAYLLTRLENVAEILLFFGPFLLVLFVRGLRIGRRTGLCRQLMLLSGLGVCTLLAMFLTGAFRTGETARACLFIYPYLLFPVAAYLRHFPPCDRDSKLLLWLVFGQSLAMQTLGGYYW